MNERIEAALHGIVSIGIVFVAMLNPIVAVALAVVFLCVLATIKMTVAHSSASVAKVNRT